MGILWTILLGLVIGLIAKLVHPGKENMGIIMTVLLGIAGSFLAGVIGQAVGWYRAGEGAGVYRLGHRGDPPFGHLRQDQKISFSGPIRVPCNIISFVFRESMIFWRQLNEGGRHVAKISSNTDQGGAQRA